MRRHHLFFAILGAFLFTVCACSKNEEPDDDEDSSETGENVTESGPEEPVADPERLVDAVLSGDPESIDLATLQLGSGTVTVRTEEDPAPAEQENTVIVHVFLYPVHEDRFRCRITSPTGLLLEERVLPPDQLSGLLTRAVEKSVDPAPAEVSFPCGKMCVSAPLLELKMRLIRSSRIRLRSTPGADMAVSLIGSGPEPGIEIRHQGKLLRCTQVLKADEAKRDAELICETLESIPDETPFLPKEEARACLDDLLVLARDMKTFRRDDQERITGLTGLMTALAPDDPRLRFEQLWFSLLPLLDPELPEAKKKTLTDIFLKKADSFLRQHPDFTFPVLPSGENRPFAGHPVCPLNPVKESPEAAPICAWLLTLNGKEESEEFLPAPGPQATRAELLGWCEAVRRHSLGSLPGSDPAGQARLRFRNQLAVLRRVREYAGAHPGEADAVMPKTFFFPYEDRAPVSGRSEFWKTVRFLILSEGKELIREASAMGTKESLRYAAELQALARWSRSRESLDELRAVLAEKMEALLKTGFRLRPGMSCGGYLTDMIAILSPDALSAKDRMVVLQAYPFEYVFSREHKDMNRIMLCLVEAGVRDPGFLLRHAKRIRSLYPRTFTDPTADNSYSILAEAVFHRPVGDAPAQQAVLQLNDRFEIRRLPSPGGRCIASCLFGNQLYLLRRDERDLLSVSAADTVSGTVTDLAMPPVRFSDFQGAVRLSGEPEVCTISASENVVAVCGENTILLYDLKKEVWKKCGPLPGRFPVCVRVRNDRLYYLCGGVPGPEGSDKILSLHSCRLDGTDPRVYFDGGRSLKHAFDTLGKGRVSGFFPGKDGWLFTVSSRNHYAKLCLFAPEKETLSSLEELSPAFRSFALSENHSGTLLGQAGDSFFLVPRSDLRKKSWLFSQARDKTPAALRIDGCGVFQMPAALLAGRYLVSARRGSPPRLADLKNLNGSPMLFLPECTGVYCGSEPGTLVFPAASDGTVFILRLSEAKRGNGE